MKKRKKTYPYGVLAALVVVFLAAVFIWANEPWTPRHRRVWVAPVQVVHPAPLPSPPVKPVEPELKPSEGLQGSSGLAKPSAEQPQVPAKPSGADSVFLVPPPAAPSSSSAPRIAIVIDDMGLDKASATKAIALAPQITLSFLPYGAKAPALAAQAKSAGHEVLLHMPMEPLGKQDPGPNALTVGLSAQAIRARLEEALARFPQADGVNNHMGSRFTADRAGMTIVLDVLREKKLFFLDSFTSEKSVGAMLAREMAVPTETRDVFLDDAPTLNATLTQLVQVERLARRKGYAIAIGHPHPSTLLALKQWIPEAQRQGFALVPVQALAR